MKLNTGWKGNMARSWRMQMISHNLVPPATKTRPHEEERRGPRETHLACAIRNYRIEWERAGSKKIRKVKREDGRKRNVYSSVSNAVPSTPTRIQKKLIKLK